MHHQQNSIYSYDGRQGYLGRVASNMSHSTLIANPSVEIVGMAAPGTSRHAAAGLDAEYF